MTLPDDKCWEWTNHSGGHACHLEKGHGPDHVCVCGAKWSSDDAS